MNCTSRVEQYYQKWGEFSSCLFVYISTFLIYPDMGLNCLVSTICTLLFCTILYVLVQICTSVFTRFYLSVLSAYCSILSPEGQPYSAKVVFISTEYIKHFVVFKKLALCNVFLGHNWLVCAVIVWLFYYQILFNDVIGIRLHHTVYIYKYWC